MAAPSFTVRQRGTDTSGRQILATDFFWQVWQAVLADPRLAGFAWKITTVQGAFMARLGGGASASAGYHDLAGCWDVRTWNLTLAEQATLWAVAAEYGIWFWKRGPAPQMGGMDEHGHAIAGWDRPLASGAAYQWTQAKAGRDGLAGNGPDYMRRPKPIVLYPPTHLLQEDYMATDDAREKLAQIQADTAATRRLLERFVPNEVKRDQAALQRARDSKRKVVSLLGGLADQLVELEQAVDGTAAKGQLRAMKKSILTALAEDPDVDGPDNPAPEALT